MSKELTNFFRTLVKNVVESRIKTGEIRKDFMQLLIELMKVSETGDEREDDKVGLLNYSNLKCRCHKIDDFQ
jgi:hypothetical protein